MRALDLKPTEAQWLEGADGAEVQRALVNNRLGLQGRAWLLGQTAAPADFARRAAERVNTFPVGRGGLVAPLAVSGTVREARPSTTDTGQVYGGTVKIEQAGVGRIWVFRHVRPRVSVGEGVGAGEIVATVVAWRSGPPHAHIELWKSLGGGYRLENMIDPVTVLR